MAKERGQEGFTLIELMVSMLLLSIITTAGLMLFTAGQAAWSSAKTRSDLQYNLRKSAQYIFLELQESGVDENGTLQVEIDDGAGAGGTDILRFAVPVCICGGGPINTDGDVSYWGAPEEWGHAGCTDDYPLEANGKVDVCHFPPGNPDNPQDLSVSEPAVKAHLAHGDYIGDCDECDPDDYPNRQVEYLINDDGQLLRQVLDIDSEVVASVIVADHIDDFQAGINDGQTVVTVTIGLSGMTFQGRQMGLQDSVNVPLRNRS